jgi:heme exporter protein B
MTSSNSSTLNPFKLAAVVLQRELRLAMRRWDQVLQPLVFFIVIVTLFPLATNPELSELRRIAPGILWVAAMLASLLAADGIFRPDVEDGTMEQWVLSGQPLSWLLLIKCFAHWVLTGLPLVLVTPAVAISLGVNTGWSDIMIALAIGSGVLTLLGAVGAALTVGLRRGNMLMALVVLPLEMPVLIFGAQAVQSAIRNEPAIGIINLLGAILLLSIILTPFAMAAAIRISIE